MKTSEGPRPAGRRARRCMPGDASPPPPPPTLQRLPRILRDGKPNSTLKAYLDKKAGERKVRSASAALRAEEPEAWEAVAAEVEWEPLPEHVVEPVGVESSAVFPTRAQFAQFRATGFMGIYYDPGVLFITNVGDKVYSGYFNDAPLAWEERLYAVQVSDDGNTVALTGQHWQGQRFGQGQYVKYSDPARANLPEVGYPTLMGGAPPHPRGGYVGPRPVIIWHGAVSGARARNHVGARA